MGDRLRHLCAEDKAKVGSLLQAVAYQRGKSREIKQIQAISKATFQQTVRTLQAANRSLSRERGVLTDRLNESLRLLNQLQGTVKPIEKPQSAVNEVKSLRRDMANLAQSLRKISPKVSREGRTPLASINSNTVRRNCSTGLKASTVLYNESLFSLLEEMESGRIPVSTPKFHP